MANKTTKTRPTIRYWYDVVVYGKNDVVLLKGRFRRRNSSEAAVSGLNALDIKYNKEDVDRVTVNGNCEIPLPKGKRHGVGFRKEETVNHSFRVNVWDLRKLQRLIPERGKGWFVTDAIRFFMDIHKKELDKHVAKYQRGEEP